MYVFATAFFLGLLVCFPICLRVFHWHLGERIFDSPDRPGRRRMFPTITCASAILCTLLNLIAFDTFLEVKGGELRYSTCFSPITHRHSLGDVEELRIYSRRVAPIGTIVDRNSLEVRLKNGSTIDTFYLIEPRHIPEVVALFEKNPLFKGSLTRIDGHR